MKLILNKPQTVIQKPYSLKHLRENGKRNWCKAIPNASKKKRLFVQLILIFRLSRHSRNPLYSFILSLEYSEMTGSQILIHSKVAKTKFETSFLTCLSGYGGFGSYPHTHFWGELFHELEHNEELKSERK